MTERGPDTDDEPLIPWDQRIFALVDPGVDETLLVENLRRTPQERLERMIAMAKWLERARAGAR